MVNLFCKRKIPCVLGLLVTVALFATDGLCDEPVKATICQMNSDPAAYNHKLVEVTGFVSHGFEDFGLFDPTCSSRNGIWVEYGGIINSGTMYCCGVPPTRGRSKQLIVEEIPVPLIDDEHFREFDRFIFRQPDSIVHATLVGRFFSGREEKLPGGISWGGYGHLGCCSLFAIQQVISLDPQNRSDLDYGASADQPDIRRVGCGFKDLRSDDPDSPIELQHKYDLGQRDWAISNPERVAAEALAKHTKIDEGSIVGLKVTRRVQGRIVYQWRPRKAKNMSYMVVVSHPYIVSFYAKDPNRITWIVIAAYESSCGGGNSVTHLR